MDKSLRFSSSSLLSSSTHWIVAIILMAVTVAVDAKLPPPVATGGSAVSATSPVRQAGAAQATPQTGAASDGTQPEVAALTTKLASLEASVSRIEEKLPSIWWLTPLITLLSVVVGGLVSGLTAYWTQSRLLTHQKQQANFDWHVQQFTELYGPLRTLFDGSNEVYRRLNEVLISQAPNRFRDQTLSEQVVEIDAVDPDGRYFEIFDDQQNGWRKFRMITDWSIVYGQNLGVDGYFDRIVDIGTNISKLIQDKAGLVIPHQGELLEAFGKYLAHFEVLKELHTQSQPMANEARATKDAPLKVREAAAFPNRIQLLVREGADELLAKIAKV